MEEIQDSLIDKLYAYLGDENVRYFKHLKGLTGTYAPVLRLNFAKKHIPIHPVSWREGMQIRNFLRDQDECKNWKGTDFDDNWTLLIELTIEKYYASIMDRLTKRGNE